MAKAARKSGAYTDLATGEYPDTRSGSCVIVELAASELSGRAADDAALAREGRFTISEAAFDRSAVRYGKLAAGWRAEEKRVRQQ